MLFHGIRLSSLLFEELDENERQDSWPAPSSWIGHVHYDHENNGQTYEVDHPEVEKIGHW
jgi:hypothetical protein